MDDAEWTIWKRGDGYVLTSVFTLTPLLDGYDVVEGWLDRYALGWEPHPFGLQGASYFTDLEPGCLADAMDRLVWLEEQVRTVNRRLTRAAVAFWAEARRESDGIVAGLPQDHPPDEIVPVSNAQPRQVWKRRSPSSKSVRLGYNQAEVRNDAGRTTTDDDSSDQQWDGELTR